MTIAYPQLQRGFMPATLQACGLFLSCSAGLGVALWLGLMFENGLDPVPGSGHIIATCAAIFAVVPLAWWLLLWAGAFRHKGRAATVGCVLLLLPPLAWALPLLAAVPGILVYQLGTSLRQEPQVLLLSYSGLVVAD